MANTPNLGLHQWAAGDSFLREEFNQDFSKIDTAVGGLTSKVLNYTSGSYTGNGSATNKITLGFGPKFLILTGMINTGYKTALITKECMIHFNRDEYTREERYSSQVALEADGFCIKHPEFMNRVNVVVHYIAFG